MTMNPLHQQNIGDRADAPGFDSSALLFAALRLVKVFAATFLLCGSVAGSETKSDRAVRQQKLDETILPFLKTHCVDCHSA